MISILFVQLGFRGDNMRNTNLQAMIESAILAAFALIIDILPLSIKLPTGGSISFAMIPVLLSHTAGALNQLS